MTDLTEPRVSLGEAAYRRLRREIVTCRLPPGQRLTEKQLAADTGFGISPLRDALTRLDHEGLVRTLPRKGYQVAPLTPKSVDDLFVAWEIVGPEIVRIGLGSATDEQLAEARRGFTELTRIGDQEPGLDSALRATEVAREIFQVLAAATGNSYLISLWERISGDMSRIWTLVIASDPTARMTISADQWLRHFLVERDGEAAAAAALGYIRTVHERVLRAVVRWPSVMASEVVVPFHL